MKVRAGCNGQARLSTENFGCAVFSKLDFTGTGFLDPFGNFATGYRGRFVNEGGFGALVRGSSLRRTSGPGSKHPPPPAAPPHRSGDPGTGLAWGRGWHGSCIRLTMGHPGDQGGKVAAQRGRRGTPVASGRVDAGT